MNAQVVISLQKCKTLSDMLDVIRRYYHVNSSVGELTKALIISNINAQLKQKISDDVIAKLKKINTMGDLIATLIDAYPDAKIDPANQNKIIKGLDTIIVMTRLKAK